MLSRRDFLQVSAATAALVGADGLSRRAEAQTIRQDDLLRFRPMGQITLLHIADLHAQLMPLWFREASVNLGVGDARNRPPHLTGRALLDAFRLRPGAIDAYALTGDDFAALARRYGRVGGADRIATLVKAIQAERPGRVLLLDGGDTWQGSYTALKTRGADMVRFAKLLGVEAMTGHWDFTYGQDRVKELIGTLGFPFLAGNVRDTTWNEDAFPGDTVFERRGLRIGVIGQAYPYTPIANPRHFVPDWSFGIQEERMAKRVAALRKGGADLIVLLSHNGFDIDRKLAGRVKGIDVILTGHTHDALPQVVKVGRTLLVASGSHGKFLSRLDLDIRDKSIADYRFRLIPVLANAIAPDAEMAALVKDIRAPYAAELNRVVGKAGALLYRRGNFNGSFDDLICRALMEERDAEIALSPGFRWGGTLLPGEDIRVEDIYDQTAITYPSAYRTEMTGAYLKEVLEDVADNLFHPDPYYQQGGDMVRAGGLGYTVDINQPIGNRISDLTLLKDGKSVDPGRRYVVAGWASVAEGVEGPPIWELVERYVARKKVIDLPEENRNIRVVGA